ncbi:MAG: efflux RND transporter periplasmic adaptor subunit [SAR324 cluster bacterium]|nr:efflux RND transporter periplasmic adaptor subunit [SAR324 cluster bacterium]
MTKTALFLSFSLMWIGLIPAFLIAQEPKKASNRPPSPVAVMPVKVEMQNLQVTLSGTLRPFKNAFLAVDDSGRIKEILKHEGEFVEEGELLARAINPSQEGRLAIAKIDLRQSLIQLDLAKKKMERTRFLIKRKVSSEEKLDEDVAQFKMQEVNVESKKAEINRMASLVASYLIKAPFSGQILSSSVDLGKWVTPAQVLFQIVNYEKLELKLGIPGKFLGKIPVQTDVEIQLKESSKILQGQITSVIHHIEESTGNFTAIVHVANPEGMPLSGLLVQVSIPIGIPAEKMFVPRDAIVRKGSRTHVVVVRDGMAQIVPVQVDGNQKDLVVIQAKGLQAGEPVIVRGNERIFPGTPVTINKDLPIK